MTSAMRPTTFIKASSAKTLAEWKEVKKGCLFLRYQAFSLPKKSVADLLAKLYRNFPQTLAIKLCRPHMKTDRVNSITHLFKIYGHKKMRSDNLRDALTPAAARNQLVNQGWSHWSHFLVADQPLGDVAISLRRKRSKAAENYGSPTKEGPSKNEQPTSKRLKLNSPHSSSTTSEEKQGLHNPFRSPILPPQPTDGEGPTLSTPVQEYNPAEADYIEDEVED